MAGEEFLLKWNDHHNSFFSIMQDLYSSESMTDVTLACGGQVFETHKIILCVCSSFFRSILNRRRDKAPIVFLKDIHPKHLEQLLQYMYNGEINVLQEDLAPLIEAARALQIKGLSDTPSGNGQQSGQQSRPPRPNAPPPAKKTKAASNKRKAESPSQIIASNHAQHQQLNYARDDLVQIPAPVPPRGGPNLKEHLEAWQAQQQEEQEDFNDGQDMAAEEEAEQLYLQQQQSLNLLRGGGGVSVSGGGSGSAAGSVVGGGVDSEAAEDYEEVGGGASPPRSSSVNLISGAAAAEMDPLAAAAAAAAAGHPSSDKHRYRCAECGKGFITPSKLQRHSYSHSGIRPYTCNFCNKSFSQSANLKTHVRNTHPDQLNVSAIPIDYPGSPSSLPLPPPLKSSSAATDMD